jgi:DNA-binding NtrC family response regulator
VLIEAQHPQSVLMQFVNEMNEVMDIEQATRAFRRQWIITELQAHRWNQCATARSLGWHRNTLTRNMAQLGIHPRKRYSPVAQENTNHVIIGV